MIRKKEYLFHYILSQFFYHNITNCKMLLNVGIVFLLTFAHKASHHCLYHRNRAVYSLFSQRQCAILSTL